MENLREFGRTLFETEDNAAVLLPAVHSMLAARQYDDVFAVMRCSFVNSHYFGVRYKSDVPDATTEERYFDRFIEVVRGLELPETAYAPLIIHVMDPRLNTPAAAWRRPARDYFTRLAARDFGLALEFVKKFSPKKMYPYDILIKLDRAAVVAHLSERRAKGGIGEIKRAGDYLKKAAPETLLPARGKVAVIGNEDDEEEIKNADDLLALCKKKRDPASYRKIRAALTEDGGVTLPALAARLICGYDPAAKKTAYLSRFLAKYGELSTRAELIAYAPKRRRELYAKRFGVEIEDALDITADDCGLDSHFRRAFDVGGFTLYARVLPGLEIKMSGANGDDFVFSENVPRKYRPVKRSIERYAERLAAELKKQTERFYNAFRFFRLWTPKSFTSNIVGNPLMRAVASEFFFGQYRDGVLASVFFMENGEILDLDRRAYAFDRELPVGMLHPRDKSEPWARLKHLDLKAPFDQLGRRVFRRPDGAGTDIALFRGTAARSGELFARLEKNEWKLLKNNRGDICGASKVFRDLPAVLEFSPAPRKSDALLTVGILRTSEKNGRIYSEIIWELNALLRG